TAELAKVNKRLEELQKDQKAFASKLADAEAKRKAAETELAKLKMTGTDAGKKLAQAEKELARSVEEQKRLTAEVRLLAETVKKREQEQKNLQDLLAAKEKVFQVREK